MHCLNRKNVTVIMSQYQLDLFLAIQKKEGVRNVYCITSSSMENKVRNRLMECKGLCVYDAGFESSKLSYRVARSTIKRVKLFLLESGVSANDVFWSANDEHQVDQCVYNIVRFSEVNLIEDGLGSYVTHKAMKYNYGLYNIVRRVAQILLYFPYYRALYGCGGNIQAVRGYCYHDEAFPMQGSMRRYKFEKKYGEVPNVGGGAPDGSVVIVGQPLVAMGYVDKRKYLEWLCRIKNMEGVGKVIIYKPHPAEKDVAYIERSGLNVEAYDKTPLEEYLYWSGKKLVVYGFLSTSLLNVRRFSNVDKVVAIRTYETRKMAPYYNVISRLGITVLDI